MLNAGCVVAVWTVRGCNVQDSQQLGEVVLRTGALPNAVSSPRLG